MIYLISKRVSDIVIASLGLIAFFPLILLISIVIFLIEGRPVFYVKKTAGENGKAFKLVKFRSMKAGSQDITKIGRILRSTAMDELPQLINIFKGEMSFVGPRPYGIGKYESGDEEFSRRLKVVPGLTGFAQVFLPKHSGDEDVLRHDLEYIKKKNFWFDMYLMFTSVWITLKGSWESTVKKL